MARQPATKKDRPTRTASGPKPRAKKPRPKKPAPDAPGAPDAGTKLLRTGAVARQQGVTRQAVQEWVKLGMAPAAKDSRGYLFDPDAVTIWRANNMRTRDAADAAAFRAPGRSGFAADAEGAPTNLNDARIRLTLEDAALKALKRKQLEGELVEKERMLSELGSLLGAARALIDQMPDTASRDICDAMGVAYAEKGPLVREAVRKVAVSLLTRLSMAADAAETMRSEEE